MLHLVFVYGTLKRGFIRNGILHWQRYLGVARTSEKFKLFHVSGLAAMKEYEEPSGTPEGIWGELYEVTEECLREIDEVEGVTQGLYMRKEIELDELHLTNLPLSQNVFNKLERKVALAYLFKSEIGGAKECKLFWPKLK